MRTFRGVDKWIWLTLIGITRLASADCLTMSNGLSFAGLTANDALAGCESDYRADAVQCQENLRCDNFAPDPAPAPYPPGYQPYPPSYPQPYPQPYPPSYPQPYPQPYPPGYQPYPPSYPQPYPPNDPDEGGDDGHGWNPGYPGGGEHGGGEHGGGGHVCGRRPC